MITSATTASELPIQQPSAADTRNPIRQDINLPRLLIISDDVVRAAGIQSMFDHRKIAVTCTASLAESGKAIEEQPDVAIVDVSTGEIVEVLKTLRASSGCENISILVEASRLASDESLRGVLPAYRAMPCSQSELILLARRRLKASAGRGRESRRML